MSSPVEKQPPLNTFKDPLATTLAAHDFFEREERIEVARAPGRLDVMGGNVDYTGGMVLQSLLREAVWVAAQRRTDDVIHILNPGAAQYAWETSLELRTGDLSDPAGLRLLCNKKESLRWLSYVLGALYFLKLHYGGCCAGGLNLFIVSDLPANKGVSSSAALEVATLKAASAAWGILLEGIALATAGQWVENVVVGAACGIMDQAAIVLGENNRLLPMLCQPCRPFPLVRLPTGLRFWGIDSMVPRSTTGVAYETARAAAFVGYKMICRREGLYVTPEQTSGIPRWTDTRWSGYLSNLSPSEFRSKYERWLPESLSGQEFLSREAEHVDPFTSICPDSQYPVRAAVRYAVEENLRVQMVSALLRGRLSSASLQLIGEILCQSHAAYSECGLGSEGCDELVARALRAGLPGAKMTGGGGGGVVAVLGRSGDRPAIHRIAQEYGAEHGTEPHIFEGSSDGVDTFGVHTLQLSSRRDAQ